MGNVSGKTAMGNVSGKTAMGNVSGKTAGSVDSNFPKD